MAGMYGADVAQLRELAARFSREAERLERDRMTVAEAIQIKAWVGPVAVRFRHEWESGHSRSLLSAAGTLREAANRLRANADQQERASAVDSSIHGVAGGGETAAVTELAEPREVTVGGLASGIRKADESGNGYYIERFVGEDGKPRYIMYISGTGSHEHLEWLDNREVAQNGDSPAYHYFESKLRAAIKEGGWGEVMVVGHSQGGMIAQGLADRGSADVKTVVTFGSPRVHEHSNYGGADVIRFVDNADPVPGAKGTAAAVLTAIAATGPGPLRATAAALLVEMASSAAVDALAKENGAGAHYEAGTDTEVRVGGWGIDFDRHDMSSYEKSASEFEAGLGDRERDAFRPFSPSPSTLPRY